MAQESEAFATVPAPILGEAIAVAPVGAHAELTRRTPAVSLEYASVAPADPRFRVGTLVYTSAGIAVLFFWLLFGDFAYSMRERSVGPTVQLFLRSLNASNFTMSLLMASLPTAIGLFLSPMVSYRSDRTRSRWGRRIPYLLIPTPVAALAMVAIAFSPNMGEWLRGPFDVALRLLADAIGYLSGPLAGRMRAGQGTGISSRTATLVVFAVAWTVFEVAVIVSGTVLHGLINDVVPRGRLGRFFGLFRSVSLIDGMIFNFFLLKFAETHFTLMFAAVAVVFGVGFTLMCLNVREGEYPPPPPVASPSDPRAAGFFAAVGIYFRECFSVPYYRWCFAAFAIGGLTFVPVNMFSLYYAKQLNMDLAWFGKLTAYSYVASLCLAYALGALVDRYHALRIGMVALILYMFAAFYGMTFIRDTGTFAVAYVTHTVLNGTYFTATASLALSLLPRAKFAQFSSAGGLVSSVVLMIFNPALGYVLDRTNSNYRLTFVAGFVIAGFALALMAIVYQQFMRRGGPAAYVAPGDTVAHAGTDA